MREYEALVAFDADGTLAAFDRAECFEDFVVIDIFVVVEVGLLVGLTGFAVVGANVVGDKVGGGVTIAGQKAPLAAVTSSTIVHRGNLLSGTILNVISPCKSINHVFIVAVDTSISED